MTKDALPAVRIQAVSNAADPRWLRLRKSLWPHASRSAHAAEMRAQADAPKRCMQFLAIGDHDTPLGLVEARMRLDPVHGAHASPTAYLEGIYVEPGARRQGVARLLLHAVMAWAHEQGCSELASDTGIDNTISRAVHEQLGFAETERVVFYRMVLGQPNQAS